MPSSVNVKYFPIDIDIYSNHILYYCVSKHKQIVIIYFYLTGIWNNLPPRTCLMVSTPRGLRASGGAAIQRSWRHNTQLHCEWQFKVSGTLPKDREVRTMAGHAFILPFLPTIDLLNYIHIYFLKCHFDFVLNCVLKEFEYGQGHYVCI